MLTQETTTIATPFSQKGVTGLHETGLRRLGTSGGMLFRIRKFSLSYSPAGLCRAHPVIKLLMECAFLSHCNIHTAFYRNYCPLASVTLYPCSKNERNISDASKQSMNTYGLNIETKQK